MTLDEYLASWLDRQRTRLQPSTWASYQATIRRYLSPALGSTPLAELDPMTVERTYARLFAGGGQGGRPLSVATIRYIHAVLHKALADAVRLRLLNGNVTDVVELPRHRPGETDRRMTAWTAAQAQTFLGATAAEWLHPLWTTALATGMRRGELLALSWDDVDLHAGTVAVHSSLTAVRGELVRKSTKTGRPRALSIHTDLVDRLAGWRRRAPSGPTPWRPVFTDLDGAPFDPMVITTAFRRQVRSAPVPTIRLHDLRHTHATLLLQAGVSVKVVSERLGHRTIALTMDTYAHVLPAMDRDAADRLGTLLSRSSQ